MRKVTTTNKVRKSLSLAISALMILSLVTVISSTAPLTAAGTAIDGTISIDKPVVADGQTITITVTDNDLNTDLGLEETVLVTLKSETDTSFTVDATETGPDTGVFTASVLVNQGDPIEDSYLTFENSGETITASYEDTSQLTTDSATTTAAMGDATMVDQDTGEQYVDNNEQKMVQAVTIYDLGVDDSHDLKIDSFTVKNTGSAADSAISKVTLWVDDGNGTWDGTGTEIELVSKDDPSLHDGQLLGGNDESAVLTVSNGGTKIVFITVTISGAEDQDTMTIKTELDGTDTLILDSSALDANDTATATSATILDTIDLGFTETSAVETGAADGYLDQITLTMNEDLTANYPTDSAFTVTDNDGTELEITEVAAGGKGDSVARTVVITLFGDKGTTGPPTVEYDASAASIKLMDDSGNMDNSFTITVTDEAGPVLMDGSYKDTDDDGTVDNIVLRFSENLAEYAYAAGDWTVTPADLGSFDAADLSKYSQSGNTITLNIDAHASSDTTGSSTPPTVTYIGGGTKIKDDVPNDAVTGIQINLTDAAHPVIISSTTTNASSTANTTQIDVTFTEVLDDATDNEENFSVTNNTVTSTSVSAGTVTLTLGTAIDRGATPEVTYTQGVLADSTGNLVKTESTTPSDDVSPVLIYAKWTDVDGTGTVTESDKIEFKFVEAMNENTITSTNVNTNLNLNFGTSPTVSWSSDRTTVTITLDTGETIDEGGSVNPTNDVLDTAGNADATITDKLIYATEGSITLNQVKYHAITNAISDASDGDTIEVGTLYDNSKETTFPIEVDESVTITSAGATKTVIEPDIDSNVFTVSANVTFKNLKIISCDDKNAIDVNSGSVTVKDSILVQNSVAGDGASTIYALLVDAGTSPAATVVNTTFKGQGLYDTGAIKLSGSNANDSIIENSTFQNLEDGVLVDGASSVVLNNNVFDNIRKTAVLVETTTAAVNGFTMENSDIKDSKYGAYFFEEGSNAFSGTLMVRNNNFENADSDGTGYALAAGTTMEATGSITGLITADNNYWNDDSGASGIGDGAGDLVEDDIDSITYSVWLTEKNGATYDKTYVLEEGLNLVSLPLIPDNSNIENILAETEDVKIVWSWNDETKKWTSYAPGAKESYLTAMVDGEGYWVNVDQTTGDKTVLAFNGSEHVEPGVDPRAYDVYEGWNLIGFKGTTTIVANDYLGTSVTNVTERLYQAPRGTYTALDNLASDNMTPFYGYWLAVSEDGTIYP